MEKLNMKADLESVDVLVTNSSTIAILGTGEFGRALADKINMTCRSSSVTLIFGSRNPSPTDPVYLPACDQTIKVVSHQDAIAQADIVVVAVPMSFHSQLPLQMLKSNQIVIDCSNISKGRDLTKMSNAEALALLCPGVPLVKAFNVLSAYSLASSDPGLHMIPIASDSAKAKEVVSDLIKKMGFIPEDRGTLAAARLIEAIPQRRFDSWHMPLVISALLWFFFFFFIFLRSFCHETKETSEFVWDKDEAVRLLRFVNKTCDNHALGLLAICYLPGVLAAYLQLLRGTKYSAFPNWLDRWMRMRKQLGLLMLFSASIHVCAYLLTFSEKRKTKSFPILERNGTHYDIVEIEVYTTAKVHDLLTNAYLVSGIVGFGLAVVLGIVSLPSVARSLSWQEFRLIQSRLGWLCLLLCTLHCVFKGWKEIPTFECGTPSSTQLPLYLPAITIILKIPLVLPWVDSRLTNIRSGVIQRAKK